MGLFSSKTVTIPFEGIKPSVSINKICLEDKQLKYLACY